MKFVVLALLLASLAANAWLAQNRVAFRASTHTAASSAASAPAAIPIPPLTAATWALIESGDSTGPDALRALGLPESAIRALIRAEVDKRYRDRENALYTSPDSTRYWSSKFDTATYRPTDHMKLLDLRREKEAELKRLLGPDYRAGDTNTDYRTAFLPPDKAEQLRLLTEDYQAMASDASGSNAAVSFMSRLPEDAEKSRFLEKQKREDLAALLTPAELAEYDLRNSTTSNQLRFQLSSFDATEAEFKTLYEIRKDFDEQFARPALGVVTNTPEQAKARREAQEAVNAQIKTALGDERYAEYERAQDQEYKTLTRVAARLDIPKEKIIEAHDLKKALEKKLNDFKPTPGTDVRQARADLQASILKEADARLPQILGQQGYEAYKDNSQAYRRLQPQPAPTPGSPTTTRTIRTDGTTTTTTTTTTTPTPTTTPTSR